MPVAWFGAREHEVPATLAERLRGSMVAASAAGDGAVADALVDAGVALVRDVAAADPMTRAQALDLLAADALITYAFEAAADDPAQLVARADAAMRALAAVGA
jgi:hypothetical protein